MKLNQLGMNKCLKASYAVNCKKSTLELFHIAEAAAEKTIKRQRVRFGQLQRFYGPNNRLF